MSTDKQQIAQILSRVHPPPIFEGAGGKTK